MLFLLLAIAGGNQVNAQLFDDAALDTLKTYTSLEEALKAPLEVYKLDLSKQKLTEFPTQIYAFKNLNVLHLNKNKLTLIPNEIKQLKYLQKISINKNKLEEWPTGFVYLEHLRELSMNRNYLSAIPANINRNKNLERLDLWSNDLTFFPEELSQLTSLVWMDLRVIQMNQEKQARIQTLLPNTDIEFDPACNCNF